MSKKYHYTYITTTAKENDYQKIYVDGAWIDADAAIGTFDDNASGNNILGANRIPNGQWLPGVIDEARFSDVVRSAAWVKAEYASLWDTLLTYGDEETEGAAAVDNAIFFGMNF